MCGGSAKVIACIEDPVVIKKILGHQEETLRVSGPQLPGSRACSDSPKGILVQPDVVATATNKSQMTGIHSGQRGPFMQDSGVIRLESSGSDCSMGASSRGNSVCQPTPTSAIRL